MPIEVPRQLPVLAIVIVFRLIVIIILECNITMPISLKRHLQQIPL